MKIRSKSFDFSLILTFLLEFYLNVNCAVPRDSRIIIVGAGAAGISALSRLLIRGHKNVLLLEASSRIGGRIKTVPFGKNVVDLGAQWVYGQKGNIVYEMAKRSDVFAVTSKKIFKGWLLSSDGNFDRDSPLLYRICEKIYNGNKNCTKNMSYADYFSEEYQNVLKRDPYQQIPKHRIKEMKRYYENCVCSLDGCDSWHNSSNCADHKNPPGHLYINWKRKGFTRVFDFITKKKPNPRRHVKVLKYIEFNKEVTNINWFDNHAGTIEVTCKDGDIYEAAHVIVTIPLGVLKVTYKTLFTPSLPEEKIISIETLNFGTVNKIFLRFRKPFWTRNWEGFSTIWTDEDLIQIEASDYKWVKYIRGFYRVSFQPRLLCCWLWGEGARAVEKLSHQEILDRIMILFEKFLEPYIVYTQPEEIIISNWSSNLFSRGSHSGRSLESDKKGGSAHFLSLPLNNFWGVPKVLFAGEATNPKYFSTVHGAVESGYREANRLLQFKF